MASVMLKPVDEAWMQRALLFVHRRAKRGEGPTWREIAAHMAWGYPSCNTYHRMLKLRKRGLTWEDGVARSTRLTDEGWEHLKAALKETGP